MNLSIPTNLKTEEIFPLITTLLQHKILDVKLEVDLSKLDKETEEALKKQLTTLEITYNEVGKNLGDSSESDDEESPDDNTSFSMSYKVIGQKEELLSKEINDYYLVQFYNFRKPKQELAKKVQAYQLEIELTRENLKISGEKRKVENLYQTLTSFTYLKSREISYDHGKCLKQHQYIKRLEREHRSDFRVIKESNKTFAYIFGVDKAAMEKFKKKFEQVSYNITNLLEIPMEHQVPGEEKEILNYFEDNYKVKNESVFKKNKINFELEMFERKRDKPSTLIYFFADCQNENQFKKIQDHFYKEIRSFCILNVYFSKLLKPETVPNMKFENGLSEKVRVVTNLKPNHVLLLGKAKHLEPFLKNNFENYINSIDYIRIRFKRFQDTPIEEMKKGMKDVQALSTDYSTPQLGTFIISDFKAVTRFLSQIEIHCKKMPRYRSDLSLNDSSISSAVNSGYQDDISASQIHPNILAESNFLSVTQERPKTENQNLAPSYDCSNLNQISITFEENKELAELNKNSLEYGQLLGLLQKGYPEVTVHFVGKFFLSNDWEQYKNLKEKNSHKASEYLLFYSSSEDPISGIEQTDLDELQNNLVDDYNPTKHKYFSNDENNKEIHACLALVNKSDQKILAYYALYFINFD